MKLKFKKQEFQTDAVNAVADCFAGQPKITGLKYRIDPGRAERSEILDQGSFREDLNDMGFKNHELALTHTQLLENINRVQRQQNLHLSQKCRGRCLRQASPQFLYSYPGGQLQS